MWRCRCCQFPLSAQLASDLKDLSNVKYMDSNKETGECIPNTNSACNAALTQVMRRQSWGQMPWRTSVVIVKTPKVLNCVPKFLHCNARTNQNTSWFWRGSEETVLGRYLAKQHRISLAHLSPLPSPAPTLCTPPRWPHAWPSISVVNK